MRTARVGWFAALALLVLLAAGCGGGGGGASGHEVTVEPTSGPPGTTISYTISDCTEGNATLYTGFVEQYHDYYVTESGEDTSEDPKPKELSSADGSTGP